MAVGKRIAGQASHHSNCQSEQKPPASTCCTCAFPCVACQPRWLTACRLRLHWAAKRTGGPCTSSTCICERQRAPISWGTPQAPTILAAGLDQSQDCKIQPASPRAIICCLLRWVVAGSWVRSRAWAGPQHPGEAMNPTLVSGSGMGGGIPQQVCPEHSHPKQVPCYPPKGPAFEGCSPAFLHPA